MVYGVQAFVVLPWFIGAAFRGEQSLWVWQEFHRQFARFGIADAFLGLYLYLVFYSVFVVVPYVLLLAAYEFRLEEAPPPRVRAMMLLVSTWAAFSFFLFAHPIFEFFRNLPLNIWNGWLLIVWALSIFLIVRVLFSIWDHRRTRMEAISRG